MKRLNQILLPLIILIATILIFAGVSLAQQKGETDLKVAALFKQGLDLIKQNEFSKAEKVLKQVAVVNPRMPGVYMNLSRVYMGLGKHEEAKKMAYREIEVNPDSAAAYNNSGYALSMLVLKDEAITILKKAIELDPKLSQPYFNLADAYRSSAMLSDDSERKSKQFAEAEKVINTFLKIYPDNEQALAVLVNIAMTAEQYEKAVAAGLKWVIIKPEDFNAQKNLGIAYLQNGDPANAVRPLEKAFNLKPDDIQGQRFFGIALATSGQTEKSLTVLKKNAPDDFSLYFGLGMTAFYAKKFNDAMEYFKQAISIEPDSAQAIYHLSLSYFSAGKRESALEQYNKLKLVNAEIAEELWQRIKR